MKVESADFEVVYNYLESNLSQSSFCKFEYRRKGGYEWEGGRERAINDEATLILMGNF